MTAWKSPDGPGEVRCFGIAGSERDQTRLFECLSRTPRAGYGDAIVTAAYPAAPGSVTRCTICGAACAGPSNVAASRNSETIMKRQPVRPSGAHRRDKAIQ